MRCLSVLALLASLLAAPAAAVTPVYGTTEGKKGQENPLTYSFFALADGPVEAWFAGSEAGFTSELGLFVNGVDTGIRGLNNKSSKVGSVLSFGPVKRGDELVFAIHVRNSRQTYFSDLSRNADGFNHIWAMPFSGSGKLPSGVFVGFEDLWKGGDKDYNDLTYVFRNVGIGEAIPEADTWVMLITGFLLVGLSMRRRREPEPDRVIG
jgi:hypothetical protein